MTIDDQEKDYCVQLIMIIVVVTLVGILVWLIAP